MNSPTRRGRAALLLLALGAAAQPALAQKKGKNEPAPTATGPQRLQPLFGGVSPAQAQQVIGAAVLADIDRSFASRPEASRFFSQKGYEYLQENQPDTAAVRFNLAYALDPKNADAYRGLAVLVSQRPNPSPEAIQALLAQGLAVAPADSRLLNDAATNTLTRYEQTKKKKDLTLAADYAQRALAADSTNANAWQTSARVKYFQEDYAGAWQAVHKGQSYSLGSLDFGFLTQLMAKAPDPDGKFK
ncbi:hypothetical protein HHL22_12540 [Hymenobacter sp. RP-2-7]|uniref:Tetratricopeptide repeat protein n=1 Tax=Hymenobacter polaris TaxID=2682546 RepID=A0A7Y0AET8_9BACT|nr:hypothetical protein [Hymenobacter polaris]NML66033.1 hypothetical protein [Hymenobacter polaris]